MDFADKIKLLLQERNMSQAELARKMKTNRSSVNYWISGRFKPKSDAVHRLAILFNVSEAWLIGVPGAMRERIEKVSKEEAELVRIYKMLTIKNRARLLSFAYDLEEQEEKEGGGDGEL